MAEDPQPNWFSRTFSDPATGGANWTSIATVGIAGAAGYLFGNLPGLLMGILGGGLLAPLVGELVHQLGGTSMPPRTTTVPIVPTVAYTPAPILQPNGQNVERVVASPILENIIASRPDDIPSGFNARDQIRDALAGNNPTNNTRENFDNLVRTAVTSERRVENFYTAMRNYQTQQRNYTTGQNGQPSEYDNLVSSVSTLSASFSNPLTQDEIRRFVPSLPSVDEVFSAHPTLEPGRPLTQIPDIATYNRAFNSSQPVSASNQPWRNVTLDIEDLAKRFFINAPAQQGQPAVRRYFTSAPTGTEQEWNNKSYTEKMNIALMALEDRRASYEYGSGSNRIDWSAIGGKDKWNAIVAAELAKGADGNISRALIEQANRDLQTTSDSRTITNLGNLIGAAGNIHAYEVMRARMSSELQPALTQLTAFRNTEMEASYRQAQSFLNARRQIFAEQHIAILANDKVPQAKCPDATERFYITYKDCNAPGSPVRTLVGCMVGDKFCVTHRFDGDIAAITPAAWNSAALRTPVEFNREAFVNLSNNPGAAFATLVNGPSVQLASTAAPGTRVRTGAASPDSPMGGDPTMLALADNFRSNPVAQPATLTGGVQVDDHGQPTGIPRKTKDIRRTPTDDLTVA